VQRIIGITGGIGTGKSTVSKYLAEHYHLPVLDADVYARQAVKPGGAGLAQIVNRYGAGLLRTDGTLDRAQLAEIIFKNSTEKHWLESLIHPYVRECFDRDLQQTTSPIVVAVIPLLFEAQLQDTVTEIWVVACDQKHQLTWLQQRDGLSLEQAQARIASQIPLTEKIKLADAVLDNSSDPATLLQQVDRLLIAQT
jgi:dephospho-CoA kinase